MNSDKTPAILDIWSHIDPRFGGVGPAAAALAKAVELQPAWRSEQIAVCSKGESAYSESTSPLVETIITKGVRPFSDLRIRARLRAAMARVDVCHVHGIWVPHSLAVATLSQELRKPFVSSVHGMLESWELANKRSKKWLYGLLIERRSLSHSACLRALSLREAADYQRFGLRNPIAVIPNGVLPLEPVNASDFLDRHPQLRNKRIVLFLSRIHRKKGILDLVRAWPTVARRHSDAHLLIAGSEWEDTGEIAKQYVSDLNIAESVTFCGLLTGAAKMQALSAATVFCLPSYSEGMSIAVLEALSIGLPVVVTDACNIEGIEESGAGYVTSAGNPALGDLLCDSLSLTDRDYQLMSCSARRLARLRYDWLKIGATMRSIYDWLLGGCRPDCVI